ncbi:MAG TPA: hypothetical protein VN938_07960, partial [Xanthobacteraceae bacterium]|nr:hypothetical protein [Xanthobacteraceae bacterium]
IRPLRLNSDSSAIRSTLPQRGQLGRPNFRVAVASALQANWMLIVGLLDGSLTPPPITVRY